VAEDTRPDGTLVEVRHKDHDDRRLPGRVTLEWLRKYGKDQWVEVTTADAESGAADGTVAEVLARVEAGEVTAADALAAEQAKGDDARSSLTDKLQALVGAGQEG
jgi:hypothetical protein